MLVVIVEVLLLLAALGISLALRPWRLLHHDAAGGLITPLLGTLAVLPFVWAVPYDAQLPFALSASGACLVVLMVGWPLAVPLLTAVGVIVWQVSALHLTQALAMTVWLGIVPATLALGVGHVLRRWLGAHPLTYLAGRAYFGTMVCSFAGALLAHVLHGSSELIPAGTELMAIFLLAMGEASVTTGMAVLLVTCLPAALATWSDRLYLRPAARRAR